MGQMGTTAGSSLPIGKWLNKCRVYVESSEDCDVLEKWFSNNLGEIDFLPVDNGSRGGGGCDAVCRQVQESKGAEVRAAGIVDRDKLFNDKYWDLLWETDDVVFRNARPYGADIHVLLRWEMESYLLSPVALARVIADAKHGKPAPTPADIEREMIEHWACLKPIMAASVVLHEQNMDAMGDGYGKTYSRGQIDTDLNKVVLPTKFGNNFAWQVAMSTVEDKLNAFESQSQTNKVEAVLRIADGKRLIERIKVRHNLQHELRGYLSRAIKELGLVPTELEVFLSSLSIQTV